jgi:hypothetical protein
MRYRGAWSHGNASVTWREIRSAVGFAVTPNDTQSRRPWAHNDKTIQNLECDRRQDKEVGRRDAGGVIAEKCPPALGRWPRVAADIAGDRRLVDLEAEFEQLSNETDTLTWLSFQYAKQSPLLKSHCSLAQTHRQLRLHGKWPHAFVGERTRCLGPSEAKQEATRGDNSRYRDAKLGLRPYRFQSNGRAKWSERVAPFRCS